MKVSFHSDVLASQHYSCICCGAGCRSFLIPVRQSEAEAIEALAAWREKLGVSDLFLRLREAGPGGMAVAKHADGRCVFLGDDNLCEIHREFGLAAKPLACQLFPFVLTPFGKELRVGLRFECKAVVENQGRMLTEHRRELNALAAKLVPAGAETMPIPAVYRGCRIQAERLDILNEAMIKIIDSDAMALGGRLEWLRRFADHVGRLKWQRFANETDKDFEELVTQLRGISLTEPERLETPVGDLTSKGRKWFGQFLFLLCQPTSGTWHLQLTWRQRLTHTHTTPSAAHPQ